MIHPDRDSEPGRHRFVEQAMPVSAQFPGGEIPAPKIPLWARAAIVAGLLLALAACAGLIGIEVATGGAAAGVLWRRRFLAQLALEADLPMPTLIELPEGQPARLTFDRVADGMAWAERVGMQAHTHLSKETGNTYLMDSGQTPGTYAGRRVTLWAVDKPGKTGAELSQATREGLAEVVEACALCGAALNDDNCDDEATHQCAENQEE